jgi:hypothetical protein
MARILRVSLFGAMPSGEEWSVNPVYNIGGDFGVDPTPAEMTTIANAIAALSVPAALLSTWSTSTSLVGARVEARDYDGTLSVLAEAVKGTASAGTGATPHPFQSAIVSSLRTVTPGASGRGRLYWPATGVALQATTLRVLNTQVANILAAVKTYLSSIETAIEVTLPGVSLVVWSRTKVTAYPVTSIQMGDVLDVQRRRRDVAIEGYSATTYP